MANNLNADERLELTKKIELGQCLQRLEQNSDFVALIKDGYIMKTLVVDSQNLLALEPSGQVRQEALEKLMSVNYFREYLTSVKEDAIDATYTLNEEA
jgi:hypothetical protein